jgi:tight adherence protein C
MAGKARRFTPVGMIDEMERKIAVAGVTSTWTVDRLLVTKIAVGGYLASSSPTPRNIGIGLVLAAGSYVLADISLDRRGKDRAKFIQKQLPDILDQMTIGVEAGLGYDAALHRVAQENDGPLTEEFGRIMQDRQLGMSREEAFKKVVSRSSSLDLKHFILALTQAENHGMPLVTVLRVQADEMRQKRKVRAEEKAMSLPVKMVIPLVLCILPALFTVILGTATFRLSSGGMS